MLRSPNRRPAFTLLELLLVLAILAAVAAVVVPQAGILLGDRRLVRSGDQVCIEMTRLRVDAMRQGRVMMLQGTVGGNSLRIKPFYSLDDATEAMDQTGSQSALLSGADQAIAVAPMQDEEAGKMIELPEGVTIESIATASSARAAEIERTAPADSSGDATASWSSPVLFYPDGTTSTAAITLAHETMGRLVVRIRGITGDATVGEVLP